jgi:large subunit ribosomal protein L18
MNDKTQARLRRARKSRVRMRTAGDVRLTVNRTPRHIYAQIINGEGNRVLAEASTLDKDLRSGATGNIEAAAAVGKLVAERAKAAGVTEVAFDRSGYKYHGRVKALADAAREGGLEF